MKKEEEKDNQTEMEKQPEAKEDKLLSIKESEYLKLKDDAQKAQEYWDRLLRLQAETENIRKRLEKEKQEFFKYANENIISDLLNILDDLQRAVDLAESKDQDLPAFLQGVEMILAHLYQMLKDYGVKPIEAKGKLFDPAFHEALMQVEDNRLPEHTVLEEVQKGYLLNERVLRTAKVKVSKHVGDH
jgi:molecular chaperone GrpE